MRKKIKHDPESIIVAEEGGKIIGCVFIIYDPWSSFIYRLGVLPKYRRKGLGTKLMEEAERILKERGTNPITLFVREDNGEVIDFYKKRGWKLGDKIFDMEK
ncbi:MAG: GNAT family N-acetyltransferase [Candidatus Aenigmarchaeota archaeon]|nr:GNAT family N-acetyltransferase [Candidatus Aenigmarchaeota archaeon]